MANGRGKCVLYMYVLSTATVEYYSIQSANRPGTRSQRNRKYEWYVDFILLRSDENVRSNCDIFDLQRQAYSQTVCD